MHDEMLLRFKQFSNLLICCTLLAALDWDRVCLNPVLYKTFLFSKGHLLITFNVFNTWFYPHHHGGPSPCRNTLPWKLAGLEHAGKGAFQLGDALLHQLPEAGLRVLICNMSHKLGDHFSVCVRNKAETFCHEELLNVLVVGNDAIMNN